MMPFLHRKSEILAAPLADTILLMNVTVGRYHSLTNPVGTRIWELLADPIDEAELIARLVAEFEVAPEDCRREVSSFLAKLRERDLLVDD